MCDVLEATGNNYCEACGTVAGNNLNYTRLNGITFCNHCAKAYEVDLQPEAKWVKLRMTR